MNLKGEPPERFGPLRSWMYRRIAEPALRPLHLRIGSEIPFEEGRLLDVGCGPGRLDRALAASRPELHVVGVDASSSMIRQARRGPQLPNLSFREASVEAAGFRREFDFALAVLTFHHWEEPVAGLDAVYRALKPGGRFWIYEPDAESSGEDLRRDQEPLWGWLRMPLSLQRRAMRHHGFTLEEMQSIVLPAVAETPVGTGLISRRGSTLRLELERAA